MWLPQRKLNSDFHHDVDRFAETPRGAEPPLPDCRNGALIKTGAPPLEDGDGADGSVAPHHDLEHDIARDSTAASFFGVLGLHFPDQPRRINTAAGTERSAACASTRAIADPGAKPLATAHALASARAAPGARALALAGLASSLDDPFAIAIVCRSCDDWRDKHARGQRLWRLLDRRWRRSGRRHRPRRFDVDAP
jgi:hypothetical protein